MTIPPESTPTAPEGTMHAIDEPKAPHEQPRRWLNRAVGGAGLTSALGDFSYETTTVILPGFLAVLGILVMAAGTWVLVRVSGDSRPLHTR
jgi:hypothetical protein